jgi:hypothetical protein
LTLRVCSEWKKQTPTFEMFVVLTLDDGLNLQYQVHHDSRHDFYWPCSCWSINHLIVGSKNHRSGQSPTLLSKLGGPRVRLQFATLYVRAQSMTLPFALNLVGRKQICASGKKKVDNCRLLSTEHGSRQQTVVETVVIVRSKQRCLRRND